MLNCPKCGADNLLTAVFCRSCGEKLDLNAIKPEAIVASAPKKNGSEKANQVVGIILAVVIVVLLLGILTPVTGRNYGGEVSSDLKTRYEKLSKKFKNDVAVTFTAEEVAQIISSKMADYSGDRGCPAPSAVGVTFKEGGDVRLVLVSKLSFLPLNTVVVATPKVTSQGSLNLEAKSVSLGYIPLPADLQSYFLDNFKTVVNSSLGGGFMFHTLQISDDKATFTVSK